MRSSIRRLATLFLCLAGGAYGQSPYKIFPSFELSAANADGEYKAVAGVKNYKPLVYDEGGITQGPQYWIRVKPVSIINKLSYEIFSLEHSREGQHIVFDIVLQSSEPVANPYAILTYNPDGQNWTACRYAEMKPLSGQRQRMRLRCSAKNVPADGWTLHIYSGNAELYDRALKRFNSSWPATSPRLEKAMPNRSHSTCQCRPHPQTSCQRAVTPWS
jgi:hypothetical protein